MSTKVPSGSNMNFPRESNTLIEIRMIHDYCYIKISENLDPLT